VRSAPAAVERPRMTKIGVLVGTLEVGGAELDIVRSRGQEQQ
jgi:hypothetical protein